MQEIGDPCRGVDVIFLKGQALGGRKLASNDGPHLIIHLILAEVAQSLDDRATLAPGCGHVARCGVQKVKFPAADFHLTRGAIGQEYDA